MSSDGCIKENDFVLIECNSVFVFLDRIALPRKIKIHHSKFDAARIVGLRYGTLLEVVDSDIHEISEQEFQSLVSSGGGGGDVASTTDLSTSAASCNVAGDNRNLMDIPENQKLSEEEIKGLKKFGHRGSDVVSFLVENSSTFQQKTAFSKEKYLKRKHKKHRIIIRLLKPTVALLTEWMTQRGRQRIGGLSADMLSQMMSYANVHSGGRYIVFDNCGGIALLSVARRLGGSGLVIDLHASSQPSRSVYRRLFDAAQLPEEESAVIRSFPLPYTETLAEDEFVESYVPATDQEPEIGPISAKDAANLVKIEKRKERYEKLKAIWSLIKEGNFDGLIIATRSNPLSVVTSYFEFVKLSRPVVIFHQNRELLAPCFTYLAASGRCVMASLASNFCREIQVLPGRTHPVMQIQGPSGYMFFGTKVECSK